MPPDDRIGSRITAASEPQEARSTMEKPYASSVAHARHAVPAPAQSHNLPLAYVKLRKLDGSLIALTTLSRPFGGRSVNHFPNWITGGESILLKRRSGLAAC